MSPQRVRQVLAIVAVLVLVPLAYHAFSTSGDAPRRRADPTRAQPRTVVLPSKASTSDPATDTVAGDASPSNADAVANVAAFTDWLTTWRRAEAGGQPALATNGLELARARRAALKHLIATNPRLALELALPVGLRRELTPEIQAELEERVDARGDFEVEIECGETTARTIRSVVVNGRSYAAYTFGRRDQQATKLGLPLHGIAIEGLLALAPSPFRELDPIEKADRGLDTEAIAVLVGGEARTLQSAADLQGLSERLIAAESVPGPHVLRDANSGEPGAPGSPVTAAVTSPASWVFGEKRVLWIKVDFGDAPGAVATDEQISTTNVAVSEFYRATSYGRTAMGFVILPELLRLPRDKSYYEGIAASDDAIAVAARTLAQQYDAANGGTGLYNPDRYDRWIVLFSKVAGLTFSGRAQIGGPRVKMHGTIAPGVVAHELGHTQSLDHAHFWLPSGASGLGPGAHVEYGDIFDTMGSASSSPQNYFNVAQKAKLGYVAGENIRNVTESGTFRLMRHDHADAAGLQGLRFTTDNVEYEFWLEHRRFGPNTFNPAQRDRLQNGVIVHWGPEKSPRFTTGRGTYLIDATAGSASGVNDSVLRVGETLVDPDAGITIKPLAVGGAGPSEYVDVQIGFGAIDGNRNPVLVAQAPAGTLQARTNLVFNATATDPDGDPVSYRWNFGDGKPQPSLSSVTTRFTKGGTYVIRISAHDGRGGLDARTYTVEVDDPLVRWTQRGENVTTATLNAALYAGGKFVAAGDKGTVLNSVDGITWSRSTTPSTTASYRALAYGGGRFVTVGFDGDTTAMAAAAYSVDGVNWTGATFPAEPVPLTCAAYGAGRFVGGSVTGRLYTSTDGATWSEVASPVNSLWLAAAFADNLFVISGTSGRLMTSPDGLTWNNRSVPSASSLTSMTRHNGSWYVSAPAAELFTSADGIDWTRIATSGRTNSVVRTLSVSGMLLGATTNGSIALTEEPRTWTTHQINATPDTVFAGADIGRGLIVLVGSRGLIYSASVPSQSAPPIAAPSLQFEGDSLKVSVGRKNMLSAAGAGFTKLELYANSVKVGEINGAGGAFSWTPPSAGPYSLVVRGVAASGESVVSATYPVMAALTRWTSRHPLPTGTDLAAAVHALGKWWIVGRSGTLLTLEADGTFAAVDFPTNQSLTGVGYANGRFVVSGGYLDNASGEDIGPIWTSTDGHNWTLVTATTLNGLNLNFLKYAAGKWLAGSVGAAIVTSSDGVSWTRQVSGISNPIRAAVYGDDRWVAVASGGKIITSLDAVRWTEQASGVTTDLLGVGFNDGVFVACGSGGVILRSTDGDSWTRQNSGVTTALNGVGVVAGSFVVAGDAGVTLVSPTGEDWARATLGRASSTLFAASGGDTALLGGRAGEIYTGSDGSSWRRLTRGTGETFRGVVFAGDRFVVVGNRVDPLANAIVTPVLFSTDGVNWTRANGSAELRAGNLGAVAFGQNTYIAVGEGGRIFTSADARDWTAQNSGITTTLSSVAVGPSSFVATGTAGVILSSVDGATWTSQSSGVTTNLTSVTYGNGRFVAVGNNGTIVHSTDGNTWTTASSGVTATLITVRWIDNVGFLAGGNSGVMVTSADGVEWQQGETGIGSFISTLAPTRVGILAGAGTQGIMLLSHDGISWSRATSPVDRQMNGMAASPSTVVTVGSNGAILAFDFADTAPAPAIEAPPTAQMAIPGGSAQFSVRARNTGGAVYQWLKDGQPIAGANGPIHTVRAATTASLGRYSVVVTSATGTVTSAAADLSFARPEQAGRLVNLSLLTALTEPGDNFTMGAVVGGTGTTGTKPLLVRAVGPALGAFGVGNPLGDPALEFFAGTSRIGDNDNWGGDAALRNAFAAVGAFPFADPVSRDAAIYNATVAAGNNSIKVTGVAGAMGAVLAELYDATPATSFTAATPRLINVSVLKHLGTGVTVGFVVGGNTMRSVLIRAIGPSLGAPPFSVPGVVADPQLAVFSGAAQIAANDNWGGTGALTAAFGQLGAFSLPPGSRDAALLADLPPGAYTVRVSGIGGTTGMALIEVYEVSAR